VYANNRLDISRSIDIGRHLFRLLGIVGIFIVLNPALRFVGYVDLTISILLFVVQVRISKHLAPGLKLRFNHFDWHKIRQLIGMGGWLLINNLGSLLFLRIDVWVCNRFVSPEAAGEYAAVLQWTTLIRHGGVIISAVVAPMIMIYYARSEIENVLRLSKVSVRVLSLMMAVPIGILCVFSSSLLEIWLGTPFIPLAPLMIITLCHLVINVGVLPLFNIEMAMNKVAVPALVTLFMGVLNFVLAISFVTYLDWGIYGVAIAGAIVLTVKNAMFTPIYAAKILRAPWYTFVKPYLAALGLLIGLMIFGCALNRCTIPGSLIHMASVSLTVGAIGLFAVWLILPKGDRRLIYDLMPGRFRIFRTKSV